MKNKGYTVVYSGKELAPAAEKLAAYIGKITGKVPAVKEKAPKSAYILISTDREKVSSGFEITAEDGRVTITGSSLHYTVRGIYAFLVKYGGVRCFTSGLTVYGQKEITIPDGEHYRYEPFFEMTDTDWISPRNAEYSLFNGLNSAAYRQIPEELGGTVGYISGFAHTLANQFCDKDKYFREHPEYFALRSGKRTGDQLCLSEPDVLRIVRSEVFDLLEKKHDPSAELQIISLTQSDNLHFCRCDKCRATDRKYGSHAGTILAFVNAVARDVKAAGYDNVAIDTFAYQYSRAVPKGIVPEDNVIIRLCSIECCFSHPFDAPGCRTNAAFLADLEGWSKICRRMHVWDYCTDFTNYVGIFPNFGVLQRDIQIFYENNVCGVYEEGNYSSRERDTEFGELRAYMIAKLLQDPYCDITAERNDFLNAYYGRGGLFIGKFLDLITENAAEKHLGIYQPMSDVLKLDRRQIALCDELWQAAENVTSGEEKRNVLYSELSWRYWKMKNRVSEFASPFRFAAEKEKLDCDIDAAKVARSEVGGKRRLGIEIYQSLYFRIYPAVSAVLKKMYRV